MRPRPPAATSPPSRPRRASLFLLGGSRAAALSFTALPLLFSLAGCPRTSKMTTAPAQIHLGLEHDAATTVVITWRSASARGEVRYGKATTILDQRQAAQSSPYAGGFLHHARLTGLTPSTRYRYRCGSGKGLSPLFTFTTAPRRGAKSALRVVALGDSRSGDVIHRKIVRAVLAEKPHLVLHTGDMVRRGSRQDQWDLFFTAAEPIAARAPILSAIGNHERNASPYYRQLVLPVHDTSAGSTYAPEAFYALDYGALHLITLSTEPVGPPDGPQTRWLRRDLARARQDPKIRWIIVMGHRPPYSCGHHRGHGPAQRAWTALFEKHHVDLTIWGHDHNYQRSLPLRHGKSSPGGITYIVTGGAGAPLYTPHADPRMAMARAVHHYVLIHAEPSRLRVEAKELSGQVFDHFEIIHAPSSRPAPPRPRPTSRPTSAITHIPS